MAVPVDGHVRNVYEVKCDELEEKYSQEDLAGVVYVYGSKQIGPGMAAFKIYLYNDLDPDKGTVINHDHARALPQYLLNTYPGEPIYPIERAAGVPLSPETDILHFDNFEDLTELLNLASKDELAGLNVAYIAIQIQGNQAQLSSDEISIMGQMIEAFGGIYFLYFTIGDSFQDNAESLLASAKAGLASLEHNWQAHWQHEKDSGRLNVKTWVSPDIFIETERVLKFCLLDWEL